MVIWYGWKRVVKDENEKSNRFPVEFTRTEFETRSAPFSSLYISKSKVVKELLIFAPGVSKDIFL